MLRRHFLSSTLVTNKRCEIKWKNVQSKLEAAAADTLVMMDCPYFGPRAQMQNSVMTVMASCDFSDYGLHPVPRCFFSKRVTDTLRKYARQTFRGPLYTTSLVADMMSDYLWHIPDARTDREILTKFPNPLHQVLSGDADIPIMLAPVPLTHPSTPAHSQTVRRAVKLEIDLGPDNSLSVDDIVKWIRRLPTKVTSVHLDMFNV